MSLRTGRTLKDVISATVAKQVIRKLLQSPFGVAVWRYPHESTVYALIDLSGQGTTTDKELEELEQSFILNNYTHSHPPKPLALKGDVIITLGEEQANLKFSPTLSDIEIGKFYRELNRPAKKENVRSATGYPSATPQTDFEGKVESALEEIRKGIAQKIVLSRFEDHIFPQGMDVLELFDELTKSYPNAFCHLTHTYGGIWLGASPERLLEIRNNRYFSTDSLAGTQQLASDTPLSQVAWTQKEIEEQAMVSRYIIDCFKRIRLREFDEIGPKTIRAGNLAHLKTEFKVDMEATNHPKLGSTMLELLHPTSAVCGYPRDAANQFIQDTEDYDRELYAGFVGPVGFDGDMRLYVNLRCMKIEGKNARLYAGAGITEDSLPDKEYAETQFKLQTLLNVLKK